MLAKDFFVSSKEAYKNVYRESFLCLERKDTSKHRPALFVSYTMR